MLYISSILSGLTTNPVSSLMLYEIDVNNYLCVIILRCNYIIKANIMISLRNGNSNESAASHRASTAENLVNTCFSTCYVWERFGLFLVQT